MLVLFTAHFHSSVIGLYKKERQLKDASPVSSWILLINEQEKYKIAAFSDQIVEAFSLFLEVLFEPVKTLLSNWRFQLYGAFPSIFFSLFGKSDC